MKITDVEVVVLESPSDYGTAEDATEGHGTQFSCLLFVHTDEGISGVAQMETQPHIAAAIVDAPGEASGMFSGLRSLAVGEDPLQVERLWERLFLGSYYYGRRGAALQAISGIDIACWDILGKATGLPISTLLGGRRREDVRAYASTLFRGTPEGCRDAAEGYLGQGFTAVKFGWGPYGEDIRKDVELVRSAREGLGEDADLMVDMGWRPRRTVKDAIAAVRAIEDFNPYWVEEPCFPEDYDTFGRLADEVPVRIAAGEAEATTWGFRQLMERGRVDVVQPDLSRCGGLTVARRVAHMAQDLNIMVCPHAWGSGILTAATLQYVSFLAGETFLEYNVSADPISRTLVKETFDLVEGRVVVPEAPGLGIEVDMSAVERLRVR